jgi:hypothetical protein
MKSQSMLTLFLVCLPLLAQAQSVQAPTGAPITQSPSLTQHQRFDQVRQACTDAAKAQGLKDYEFDRSVRSCFLKNSYVIERERKCQQEGIERGLVGRDFRPFIRRCMTE